jgi:hypothetical protein
LEAVAEHAMMLRRIAAAFAVLVVSVSALGCGKLFARWRKTPTAALGNDAGCPESIHPGYCRRSCRTYASRQATKHARRVSYPTRYAFGTCAELKVFAEDDKSGGGLVEYYDASGNLVGAVDRAQKACGQYGTIPTCALELEWKPTTIITTAPPSDSDDGEESP